MTPDGKGVYRWRYSVNLYRNPGLLWLFYKVFGGIFAGCLLFVLFLGDFKVSPEGAKWVLVGFGLAAREIVRDLRAETQRRNRPPRAGQNMEAPIPPSPLEKRLRQLDEWREIGLIEREEYEKLKKQAEKGAYDE